MSVIPVTSLELQNSGLETEILGRWRQLFRTNHWTSGQEITRFETNFAKFHQSKYGIGMNSGTMSLWATLWALKLPLGSEVITTAMTFSATADAVVLAGLTPVFAEIDPLTGNLDPVAAAAKITPATKVILVVHLYGVPADMAAFKKLAKLHHLVLIEDASHAHGASLAGQKVGSFGAAGCFSLYPSKSLGALGNAGVVVTQSRVLAEKIRRAAHHGMDQPYTHVSFGLNGLMDNVQATALNCKLKHLSGWLKRKRAIAAIYDAALHAVNQTGMVIPPVVTPSYYTYAFQVAERSQFQHWCAQNSVATKIYYPTPLHLQPSYRKFGYRRGDLPITEKFARQTVSVPLFPELTDAQVTKVATVMQRFFTQLPNRKKA
ncbi:MAG TPA: erythromycin biosynthesis sensory transduction protein eryC1 [Candidatus Pacebacteria bacterium]|nr:erythromycin biosynthesis sensory transduction protein eryC1 [Candidatus Paceibacterota bacterium]